MVELSAAERELAVTLEAWAALAPPLGGQRYGSLYALLFDTGSWFAPAGRPGDIVLGGMGFCFSNAVEIAASRPGMHYAEGLALLDVDGRRLPVPHAWVTPDGRSAVDVTWSAGRGVAYLGLMLSPAAWAARPWWESSPLLDVHARPELLAAGLPVEWQAHM